MPGLASDTIRTRPRYGTTPLRQALLGYPNPTLQQWVVILLTAAIATLVGFAVAGAMYYLGPTLVVAAAAMLLSLAISALIGLKRFLLVMLVTDLVLSIDNHLFYQEALGNLGSLGGLSISLGTVALAGLYVLWFVELFLTRRAPKPSGSSAVFWALVYVVITAVSTIFASSVALASFELLLLVEMLLLLVYFVYNVRTRHEVVFIVSLLFAGLAVQGLITSYSAVSQQLFDVGPLTNYVDPSYRQGLFWRSGGTLGSPNVASGFFSMVLALAFAVMLGYRRSTMTVLAMVGLAMGFVALVFTQSRGGWVAFAVAATLVVLTLAVQRRLRAGVLIAMVVVALLSAPLAIPLVLGRTVDDGGALASRGPLNEISWRMITRNPMFGVGPNNFALTAPSYITPDLSQSWFYTVHNKYLLVWAESGTITLLAFVGFLLSSLRLAYVVVRQRDELFGPLALGIGAAIVGHMIHFGFDIFNARTSTQLLWILVALLTAIASQSRSAAQTPEAVASPRNINRWEALAP